MILPLNTLIVEDHPFVLEVYKNSCLTYAQHHPDKVKFNIKTAASSEEALRHAGNFLADQKLDLAMLDLRIPASEDGSIQSGLDLGIYLKKHFKDIKVIVITGHYQDLILSNVLNELDPIALVYKSDLENSTFTEMFEDVLQGTPYYSLTVLQLIRKKLASKIVLDRLDKMLLHELYKGQRTKDLTKTIPLSIGGIEKRKRQLKELFNTMHQNDEALINSAIEHGFL